jgi:CRISP-associated protein Cas1
MQRFIDLSTDGLHIAVDRGFLQVNSGGQEVGRVALDDIGGVIGNAHGLTWSSNVAVQLAERAVPMVLCASNHKPVACLWPIEGHHLQMVLESVGQPSERLKTLARNVRSGDVENAEAQAARYYWPLLMGENFRRDLDGSGSNGLLNYGYAILRSAVARSVCAAGLHPTLGLFHSNRSNAFALVDDLMEPFRPLVDRVVFDLVYNGDTEVTPQAKRQLVRLTLLDLPGQNGTTPLFEHCHALAHSLSQCYAGESDRVLFPLLPSTQFLQSISAALES